MRLAPEVTALALALLVTATAPSRACAELRIVEILAGPGRDWDGSGVFSSRDDEWIELMNTGPAALDLAGYVVTDSDSIPRYGPTGTLAPGERRVVFGIDAWNWERATGHPAFGLSLGNSGDQVIVWHVAGAETLLVDSYAYRSHEAAADRSVGLTDAGTWAVFDSLNPYTGSTPPLGNGCAPTPGQPNACSTTPTVVPTWGALKRIYR